MSQVISGWGLWGSPFSSTCTICQVHAQLPIPLIFIYTDPSQMFVIVLIWQMKKFSQRG